MPRVIALVPAAGTGTRFGAGTPKQYATLLGQPLLHHVLSVLATHAAIEQVIVALAPGDTHWNRYAWQAFAPKLRALFCGGETRAESVSNALAYLAAELKPNDWILVHDAARPCLKPELLDRLIGELRDDDVGGLLAVPMTDTLKRADGWQRVESTEPRERLWRAQTPQMFRYGVLQQALAAAPAGVPSDESWAVEKLGLKPRLVHGDITNLKVTFPDDIAVAERLLRAMETDAHRPGI
jgi:2-C-methyl-D-erythritol 4-phosphate cytidylyltransferase